MNIMHTMARETRTTQVPKRRFYSPELKLQVVRACAHPGASIAGVALQHGINTNIVHRWIREHSQGALIVQQQAFVPVTLSTEFEWPHGGANMAASITLTKQQFDALVLGLPWSRLEQMQSITRL